MLQIGAREDFSFPNPLDYPGPGRTVDLTKRLTVHQVAALVSRVALFLGSDSSMLHVAGTTETPIVGLFTSVKGDYRVPFRHGCTIVRPQGDCYGCLAMEEPPESLTVAAVAAISFASARSRPRWSSHPSGQRCVVGRSRRALLTPPSVLAKGKGRFFDTNARREARRPGSRNRLHKFASCSRSTSPHSPSARRPGPDYT